MLEFGFYNMDCMQGMKEFPDKYFDLAIVDPPYGVNIGETIGGSVPFGSKCQSGARGGITEHKVYHAFDDSKIPEKAYFEELERVAKNMIIWGGITFLTIYQQQKE